MTASMPSAVASDLGVEELLHFTTEKGVLGFLRKGALLSRQQVQDDEDLAFISLGVWPRRDPEWIDHVSLSLSEINRELHVRAAKNLPDLWWAILSFQVEILDDPGVTFTTTNNVYADVCKRATGVEGLLSMFQPAVPFGYHGSIRTRSPTCPTNRPTDPQAEVLYPKAVSLDALQRIYVPEEQHRSLVLAWCDAVCRPEPTIEVRQELFA